jgi:hypothetical protein
MARGDVLPQCIGERRPCLGWLLLRHAPVAACAVAACAAAACCGCSADIAVGTGSSVCTPAKNQRLLDLLNAGQREPVDNVLVCGVTISASRDHAGGPHGGHEILPLQVAFPDGSSRLVEVVANDDLDGEVSAPAGAAVMAYGQAFFGRTGRYAAGIHEVHCATHRGADDGWVTINGQKFPKHC